MKEDQKNTMIILWRETRKIFKKEIRNAGALKRNFFRMIYNKALPIAAKPEGKEGILFSSFTSSRAVLYKWALSKFILDFNGRILDIGFGLGYFIEALAKTVKKLGSNGTIYGLDHSKTMTEEAIKRNTAFINEGLVSLHQGEVSRMIMYEDGFFDNIVCIATAGFFPNLTSDLSEIRRVLKKGGELIIILQMYDNGELTVEEKKAAEISNFNLYSRKALENAFSKAGFTKKEVFIKDDRAFILIKCTKLQLDI